MESEYLSPAVKSLERIQAFDANSLIRSDALGKTFDFSAAVDPAKRIISFFQKLPSATLEYFPDIQLQSIQSISDSSFALFNEVLEFDNQKNDAATIRKTMITTIESQYQQVFNVIYPFISFSVARTANFNELADQGRSAVQAIRDEVSDLLKEMKDKDAQAKLVLAEVRKAAAERGVSQEAYHFSEEAKEHADLADKWRKYTIRTAFGLGGFAFLTIFLHKIPWIAPATSWEAAQLIVAKVLVFGVLAFMLALCSRNFLSHKHNQIVNKHRQNALMTFRSLVEAGGTVEARDIVLQHAASAIYQLHDTGYIKVPDGGNTSTIIDMLPRIAAQVNPSSTP